MSTSSTAASASSARSSVAAAAAPTPPLVARPSTREALSARAAARGRKAVKKAACRRATFDDAKAQVPRLCQAPFGGTRAASMSCSDRQLLRRPIRIDGSVASIIWFAESRLAQPLDFSTLLAKALSALEGFDGVTAESINLCSQDCLSEVKMEVDFLDRASCVPKIKKKLLQLNEH